MSSLHGKRLLVVLGSYRSKRHIYEHASNLGVRLVVLDGPDHWAGSWVGPDALVERHLAVDLAPLSTFAERGAAAIVESGLRLDGIGTIDEFAGGFAARIARQVGLPFHTIEAADRARDKHRAREACARAGLAGPRFARIESVDDLDAAAARVGFPAVLKPVSGVGSVQAYRVDDKSELRRRYSAILDEVLGSRSVAKVRLGSDRDWFQLMWTGRPCLVLESWIDGPKYDVDLLLDAGRTVYAHATDDLVPCGLRDVRRVAPAGLDPVEEAELIEHAAACVRAIGFLRGAFNVEVKRAAGGPRMIEVNGRLGGYSTPDIHRAVWGVDLVEQWLRSCLGMSMEVPDSSFEGFVAESLLPSPKSGILRSDGFLDHLKGDPSLVAARPWAFAGDAVAGIETGAPDWLGAVLARGETRARALSELDRLVNLLSLPAIFESQ